jgi:hypothetical protein
MTVASACADGRTPRVKRCGSSSSSSAEKLFEWPLCGVADRNRRLSKRGARSRTTLVTRESTAYFDAVAGAAAWASSRMSSDLRARSPSRASSGSRYSGRRSVWYEMMNRLWVVHGLQPKPRSWRRRAMNARL